MFNSTVLEVGIGLIFCFSAVSLIVSSVNEGIASIFKLRSKNLLSGIKDILNDHCFDGLALEIYNHAAINPHGAGTAEKKTDLKKMPSYIEPKTFAHALVDVLEKFHNSPGDLESAIRAVPDPQLRTLFIGMYERAGKDCARFEEQVGVWFDTGMDRLAGAYKRKIQLFTVLIAFTLAALLNIDFFHLFKMLWMHPSLTQELSSNGFTRSNDIAATVSALNTLPVGWEKCPLQYRTADLVIMFFGWMVTALSALFGAPFWFDILQKATNLRGTGRKVETGKKSSA